MGRHISGTVWVWTARDKSGREVRLAQQDIREHMRTWKRAISRILADQPAMYHDFKEDHLPREKAEQIPWGPLRGDSSTPSARSKAGGAKAPWSLATAAKVLARINAAWRRGLMRVEKMLTGRDLPSTGRQQKE